MMLYDNMKDDTVCDDVPPVDQKHAQAVYKKDEQGAQPPLLNVWCR
jgi:hypothetical protein